MTIPESDRSAGPIAVRFKFCGVSNACGDCEIGAGGVVIRTLVDGVTVDIWEFLGHPASLRLGVNHEISLPVQSPGLHTYSLSASVESGTGLISHSAEAPAQLEVIER